MIISSKRVKLLPLNFSVLKISLLKTRIENDSLKENA